MGKFGFGAGALCGLLVAGCAGVPQLDIPSRLTVAQIVDKIQCEVWQAWEKNRELAKKGRVKRPTHTYLAVASLTLQVDDSAGVSPTVSFIEPLAVAGTQFTFGASAALKGARQRIYTEAFSLLVDDAKEEFCNLPRDNFDLTGDLGIVDAVDLGLGSTDPKDRVTFAEDKEAFGHSIQFVVTKSVSGVGPTWTLVNFTGPGGLLGAERVDTHRLLVSFVRVKIPPLPKQPKGAKPLRALPKFAPALRDAEERGRQMNYQLQLQSLPAFRR